MAAIDDLILQVQDKVLRERLKTEFTYLAERKRFGLVFEEHIPELLPVYTASVQKGSLVAERSGKLVDTWQVLNIRGSEAECRNRATKVIKALALDDLVVVREFGNPIFPSLVPIDRIQNGPDDAPWHILIEADNYHALQLLGYLYAGKVDCIYIDPPYNTGARDWKYNNDYVDKNDRWRHSKWLAMMRRRLVLTKSLLRPEGSVLLVTIDDNELSTLNLLLDQIFPDCERQIVSITINPKGKSRVGRLSQVNEYLIVVYLGDSKVSDYSSSGKAQEIRWRYLRRNDMASKRGTTKGGPHQFYPIYVDKLSQRIVKIGEPLSPEQSIDEAPEVPGAVAVFPINEDGVHMNWGLIGTSLKKALDEGYVRVTPGKHPNQPYTIAALTAPNIQKVDEGIYQVTGTRPDGSKIVVIPEGKESRPSTVWTKSKHDAGAYGTSLIRKILPDKEFTFPKSLYAVEDTLRLFLSDKPNALVLDFFAGSGTTAHALMRLNSEDSGNRQCILVTNNEVSEKESQDMSRRGIKPGDEAWEQNGICRSITWPRCKFSIQGKRDDGSELNDTYITEKMITKERPRQFHQLDFVRIEELRTTAKKKRLVGLIKDIPQAEIKQNSDFFVSENAQASILFDELESDSWLDALEGQEHIRTFYIVTPSQSTFNKLKAQINELLGPIQTTERAYSPMRDGFPTNMEYFKIDFLEKDHVALGKQFREVLPLLWLRAGAIGPRPSLNQKEAPPQMILPNNNRFAVLVNETQFPLFLAKINRRNDLTHVFLVTDSEEAFQEMATQIQAPTVVQLDLSPQKLYQAECDYLT